MKGIEMQNRRSLREPLLQAPSTFGCVLVTPNPPFHELGALSPQPVPWPGCGVPLSSLEQVCSVSIPPEVLEEPSPPPLSVPLQ